MKLTKKQIEICGKCFGFPVTMKDKINMILSGNIDMVRGDGKRWVSIDQFDQVAEDIICLFENPKGIE